LSVNSSTNVEKFFNTQKKVMTSALILCNLNFSLPFQIKCDVFAIGVRVLLVLEGHSIALKTCKLKECESHNSTFDKEMLAILVHTNNHVHAWSVLRLIGYYQ
jgi:hypothetical protein